MNMKRIILLCCVLAALFFFSVTGLAAGSGVTSFSVNPYGNASGANDTVDWCVNGSSHFLFLPANTKPEDSKVYFKASAAVTLDGTAIKSGDSAAALFEGQTHTLICDGKKTILTVLKSENIPAVYIKIKNHTLSWIEESKSNKDKADIRIYENGKLTVDVPLSQIKGRGNSTWTWPKKPYNIKFEDKIDLFGMGKAKKYSLLASYGEKTLLHNPCAFMLAERLGMYYTSKFKHIDLFINGEYRGNYILCESVEVGDNRVAIDDLDKANEEANPGVDLESLPVKGTGANGAVLPGTVHNSRKWLDIPNEPENITGGYLMELDYAHRYDEELCGFVTSTGQPVTFKCPELATKGEIDYISSLVDAAFRALKSPTGYNKEGKHYTDYFDKQSLVNAYILEEYSKDYDAGLSSFYLFKRKDSNKLFCSPAWDFDSAFNATSNRFGAYINDTTQWFANELHRNGSSNILNYAYRHADFRSAVATRYSALTKAKVFETLKTDVKKLGKTTRASAVMNAVFWATFGTRSAEKSNDGIETSVNDMLTYLSNRAKKLSLAFSSDCSWVTYDMNGALFINTVTAVPIVKKGQSITLSTLYDCGSITPPVGKQYLQGWNTKADGSGTMYKPGQKVSFKSAATILYAIWGAKPVTANDKAYTPGQVSYLSAYASGNGAISLKWLASPSIEQYYVYRLNETTKAYEYIGAVGNATRYTVKGLTLGKTYYFSVRAISNEHGIRRAGPDTLCSAKAVKKAVSMVDGLKTTKQTTNAIKLSWNAAKNADKYYVYRSTDRKNWTMLVFTKKLAYTDKSVKAGKKYYYIVTGFNSAENSIGPYSLTLITQARTAAPKITSISSTKAGTVTVSWGKVTGAAKYIVYKSSDNKTWTKAKALTGLKCTLSKLPAGKKIYIKVVSLNAYDVKSAVREVKSVTVKK